MRDQRGRLLGATLGFLSIEPREPELQLLHRCFDNWRGIGDIVAGMARQGYDLELRRYDGQGWRALFFAEGFERDHGIRTAEPLGNFEARSGRPEILKRFRGSATKFAGPLARRSVIFA
jgi:hypothetical protein